MSLLCETCGKHRPIFDFSSHSGFTSGFDTSRCKPCKEAELDFSRVPLDRRIYHRTKSIAAKSGLEFSLDFDDIFLPDRCPVFGLPFIYGDVDWSYYVDRLDNDKGYIKGNIVIVSLKARRIRSRPNAPEHQSVLEFYRCVS